jgi:pimeloyl-ACP methyl ester carboxylesterase
MTSQPRNSRVIAIILGALLLSACGAGSRFEELRYDQPARYYLHIPDGYSGTGEWPLFIALHNFNQDSQDCIAEWFEIAEENQFFLLCPELDTQAKLLDLPSNERVLAEILNQLYQQYAFRDRFFLAGKGEAASFALKYAFRYPQAIEGVSAVDTSSYPSGVLAGSFPILVIVERRNQEAIDAGNAFIDGLDSAGTQTRLIEIDNLGGGIPYSVQRLTVDLFEQVSR